MREREDKYPGPRGWTFARIPERRPARNTPVG